jgi:hypothetical protein
MYYIGVFVRFEVLMQSMVRQSKKRDHVQLDLEGNPIENKSIEHRFRSKQHNGLPSLTREELIERLEWVQTQGWVKGEEMGDGTHGHTLEVLLGVPENNFAIPDLGEFELKSSLKDANTPVTLFSKVPTRIGSRSLSEFIQRHGYWDEKKNRQALYCTISATEKNSLGWLITIDHEEKRIEFLHQDQKVAHQEIIPLKDIISRKVQNLALVIAERMKLDGIKRYRYSKAYLLTGADSELLVKLIQQGAITFDWRMHIKPDGSARDHGSAYRMKEKNLLLLYKNKRRLL